MQTYINGVGKDIDIQRRCDMDFFTKYHAPRKTILCQAFSLGHNSLSVIHEISFSVVYLFNEDFSCIPLQGNGK